MENWDSENNIKSGLFDDKPTTVVTKTLLMYDLKGGLYDVMSTLYISIPGPLNFQIVQISAVDYPESHTFITECITQSVM
jgi:hypothetical protein